MFPGRGGTLKKYIKIKTPPQIEFVPGNRKLQNVPDKRGIFRFHGQMAIILLPVPVAEKEIFQTQLISRKL